MIKLLRIILILCLLFIAKAMGLFKYQYGSVTLGTRLTRDLSARRLHLTLDDKKETLTIKKQSLAGISKRPSRRDADMDLYATADRETVCTNELFDGEYSLRCMKHSPEGYSYITRKRAIYVANDESINLPSTNELLKVRDAINRKTGTGFRQGTRKRGMSRVLITPKVSSDTAFIKIRIMMDVAFFNRFLDFVGGDVDEAKAEIECFVTLVMNHAALYYNNLKDLGKSISSSDGQQYKVDFLPYLYDILFPPQNPDGSFYDIPAIVNNREGRFLVTKVFDSGDNNIVFDVTGVVIDFGIFQSATFPNPQPFNLIHFLTGDYLSFDFYKRISNDSNDDVFIHRVPLLGVSYIGSLCGNFESGTFDGRHGFSSFTSENIGRIVAHEIGHNIGCFHDVSESCPAEKMTLMSPYIVAPTPSVPDYYKWSNCSGEEIVNYFEFLNLTSAQIVDCLFTDYPSEVEFLDKFCKGVLGSRYDLNNTCELVFGDGSFLCTNGSSTLAAGYVDECQTTNGPGGFLDPLPLLYCSKDDSCENSPNALYMVFDGTKCANPAGVPAGNMVCYRGKCVEKLQVCVGAADKTSGLLGKRDIE